MRDFCLPRRLPRPGLKPMTAISSCRRLGMLHNAGGNLRGAAPSFDTMRSESWESSIVCRDGAAPDRLFETLSSMKPTMVVISGTTVREASQTWTIQKSRMGEIWFDPVKRFSAKNAWKGIDFDLWRCFSLVACIKSFEVLWSFFPATSCRPT